MSKKRGLPTKVEMRHDAHYVDSLTRRFEQHVGKYVSIDRIDPNPGQPRKNLGDLSAPIIDSDEGGSRAHPRAYGFG